MADIFGRDPLTIKQPITADKSVVTWDGTVVTAATQITINYSQQINRRRAIGNRDTIIYAAQPVGQIQMGRLITSDMRLLFGTPSWTACGQNGNLTLELKGGCGEETDASSGTFHATGCVVTNYSVSAEAEGLTVIDQVTVEFLQLTLS